MSNITLGATKHTNHETSRQQRKRPILLNACIAFYFLAGNTTITLGNEPHRRINALEQQEVGDVTLRSQTADQMTTKMIRAPGCAEHIVVAFASGMMAIIANSGDSIEYLRNCYEFYSARTILDEDIQSEEFRGGEIITLRK